MPRVTAFLILAGVFVGTWFVYDALKTGRDRPAALDTAARVIVADAKCPGIRFDPARSIEFLSGRGIGKADLRSPEFKARVKAIEAAIADDTEHARFCTDMRGEFGPDGSVASVMTLPEAGLPPIN